MNYLKSINVSVDNLVFDVNKILTELNYLKFIAMNEDERKLINSTCLMLAKVGQLSNDLTSMVDKLNKIIKVSKLGRDEVKVWKGMLNSANSLILSLSNSMTTAAYFMDLSKED